LNNAGGHILTAGASQSAIYQDYTTVKSWADMSIDLGWMHALDWVQLNVTDSGTYKIKDEVIGLRNVATSWVNQNTTINPSLTLWSLAGSTFTSSGSNNNAI
jgi:hypothetical protein